MLRVICFKEMCEDAFEQRDRSRRRGCLWKPTGYLAQGADCDPKLAGQMAARTPAFCCWPPVEMSNTMMWCEAAGELPSRCKDAVKREGEHGDRDSYCLSNG